MTDLPRDEDAFHPVESADDLARARSEARAFVFLWVAWAGHARFSERSLRTLLASWRTNYPETPAPAFKADVSDGRGGACDEIRGWLDREGLDVGRLIDCGAGPVLWLRDGRVVAHAIYPATLTPEQLMAKTEIAFASEEDRTAGGSSRPRLTQ